ncbi:hypothetical protein BH18ACT11_BH18ACT11_03010 [soil metagenome]
MLIYVAGPLFSEVERRFNLELTEKLEALGFRVSRNATASNAGDHPTTR